MSLVPPGAFGTMIRSGRSKVTPVPWARATDGAASAAARSWRLCMMSLPVLSFSRRAAAACRIRGWSHPRAAARQAAGGPETRRGRGLQTRSAPRGNSVTRSRYQVASVAAHHFLEDRGRRVQGQVQPGHQRDRPGTVVRRERLGVGLGQRRDLAPLGQPAAPGDVQHDEVDCIGGQQIAERDGARQRLAAADRHVRVCRRRSASARASSILAMGSSAQNTPYSSSARQMRIAAVGIHMLCNSAITSIRSPTASLILRNGSRPALRSSSVIT